MSSSLPALSLRLPCFSNLPDLDASSGRTRAGGGGSHANKQGRGGGNQGQPSGSSSSQGQGRVWRLASATAVGNRGRCCGDGSQAGAAARIRKGGGGNQVGGPCPLRFGLLPHPIWPPSSPILQGEKNCAAYAHVYSNLTRGSAVHLS